MNIKQAFVAVGLSAAAVLNSSAALANDSGVTVDTKTNTVSTEMEWGPTRILYCNDGTLIYEAGSGISAVAPTNPNVLTNMRDECRKNGLTPNF
jgi:hypothetical protein